MNKLKVILEDISKDVQEFRDGKISLALMYERVSASIQSYEEISEPLLQVNGPDNYDSIPLVISSTTQPIAWNKWKQDLVENNGLNEEEATKYMVDIMLNDGIEFEIYYETGQGFMGIEAEAVEATGIIYSPYTGEEYKLSDEEDDEPTIEPEDCERCSAEAEKSGIEYTKDFEWKDGCWHCEHCGQPQ